MKAGVKLTLITLPVAAIGAGILAFVMSNSPPPERIEIAERAYAVRVIEAETHEVTPTIIGFGRVSPTRTYDAIAQVGGQVDFVHPELLDGQILPAGSVLLSLSEIDFNLAIAQAEANIRAAQARLDELDVAGDNQRAALEIEREVLAVKASDLTRAETLFTGGTLTQSARDVAHAAHLEQRKKVQSAESALALIPTQHAVQVEQIAVYQIALTTAQTNLERSVLTLPFDARVASHRVEIGQFLSVGHTAASLDGIDSAEVEAQVSMSSLRALMQTDPARKLTLPTDPTRLGAVLRDIGLFAEVRLRLGNELVTWPATVHRISDEIDQTTGTVGIVVQVQAAYQQEGDNSRPPLTKGMFVSVALSAPPIHGVVLPRRSLHEGQVHTVGADNRLKMLTTSPQWTQGGLAIFSEGVDAGSRILLNTPSPVIEGLLLEPHLDTELMLELLAQDTDQ